MDIKEKLKGFIDKQKLLIKNQSLSVTNLNNVSIEDFKNHIAVNDLGSRSSTYLEEISLTPEAEQAVIDSIDKNYFIVDNSNVSEIELKRFPDIADIHVITGVRSRLRKQQVVITRRASNLIGEKQNLCSNEMSKLAEMQKDLCKCINLCSESRSSLNTGRSQFTSASLGILSNYKKRQRVATVINALKTIRTLQMTEIQLQKLIKAEEYAAAIQLLLECQRASKTYKHFDTISELHSKLEDTLEITIEQLDAALSKVVLNYSPKIYEDLFEAFNLLGKTQTMTDQLHMHFASHIHNSAFTVILGYIELCKSTSLESPSYSKLQYSDLCKYVNCEFFLPCFLDLSKTVWNLLRNYSNIIKWHSDNMPYSEANETSDDILENENMQKYIEQKFDHGKLRLWQDVQSKVRIFIVSSNLSHYKFDDFLKVLALISKVIDVGEAFCGDKSETLHESIKQQSLSFFGTHHLTRMEEIHMFLENEGWHICPVKESFSVLKMTESNFFKGKESLTPGSSPTKGQPKSRNLFDHYFNGSPFDISSNETTEDDFSEEKTAETLSEDSDDDLPEELKKDFVEDQVDEVPKTKKENIHNVPMVTNTTLTILRLMGKYVQMMWLLKPIAFDVFICLIQLFEYFLYALFILFTERKINDRSVSPRLQETLQRIKDNLIFNPNQTEVEEQSTKIPNPTFGHEVLNDSAEGLYSLPVRVVAAESLLFLANQLESLHPKIEMLIPGNKSSFLEQFYSNTVKMASEVRYHVYSYVALRVVDYDALLNKMMNVKWDISDLLSEHSPYVDILVRQLQLLSMRIDELRKINPIPKKAVDALWEEVIRNVNRTLLEGYASAKKCTNEGRSLMQLDYQQFLMKLESLTSVKPIPDRSLVETFIKAYYLPEGTLYDWVQSNLGSYNCRQLIMLVNCMTHVNKRTRQKIIAILEENGSKIS